MAPLHILACILSLQLVALAVSDSEQAKISAVDVVASLLAPQITPAPSVPPSHLQRRQNIEACDSFQSILYCGGPYGGPSVTPYALCACYTSGTFAASYVDGLALACSQYVVSAGDSRDADVISSFTSFCASIGDVASSLTSTVRSCQSVNSRDLACASESSNLELYGTLGARAACACYSGTVFSGSANDEWASICYEKASIADDAFASTIREFTALCSSLGDVRAEAQTTGGTNGTTTRLSPAPTGLPSGPTYTGIDPNDTQQPQETNSGGSTGLSGGALAGAIVGAIGGTALLSAAGFFIFWRRKMGNKAFLPPAGHGGMDGDQAVGGIEQEVGGIADIEYQSVPIPPPPMGWHQQSQPMG